MSRWIPAPVKAQFAIEEVKHMEYLGSVSPEASVFTPLEGLPVGTRILVLIQYPNSSRIAAFCLKITASNKEAVNGGCWSWSSVAWESKVAPDTEQRCIGTTTFVGVGHIGISAPACFELHFYHLRERAVQLESLAAIGTDERTRLSDVYDSAQQIERTPFVLSQHQEEGEGKEGIIELKDEIELVVDTLAGLERLIANPQTLETLHSRSSLVTLYLSFPEAFEPAEVTTLLQSLGPHMAHLKAQCTTADHCGAIVKVMGSCPEEHLRVVSLLETKSLDRQAMGEFLQLKKTGVEVLQFSEMPSGGLDVVCHLGRLFPSLDVKHSSDGAVPEVLFPSKWPVKEAVPLTQLPKGQWAFITADPTSYPPWVSICVPVDEARVKQHSQLLARMAEGHDDAGTCDQEPRVFNASGEVALNVCIVQLLVAYIENADVHCLEDYPELTYSISLVDEYFLMLLEERCGQLEYAINATALELLRAGDYLQMPALRRMMRSFLVRRDARQNKTICSSSSETPNRKRGRADA